MSRFQLWCILGIVRGGMFENPLARDTSVEATRFQYAALARMGVSGRMELMFR